jgi:hypothetical protein
MLTREGHDKNMLKKKCAVTNDAYLKRIGREGKMIERGKSINLDGEIIYLTGKP